jgi:hypothetical protein
MRPERQLSLPKTTLISIRRTEWLLAGYCVSGNWHRTVDSGSSFAGQTPEGYSNTVNRSAILDNSLHWVRIEFPSGKPDLFDSSFLPPITAGVHIADEVLSPSHQSPFGAMAHGQEP